ncbi:MAG TPA: hypothetical protein P5201_11205, partial [Aminobacteriaceae bacterium]|nr:hypothetical protein [Aminobacteriaceae bacterium]
MTVTLSPVLSFRRGGASAGSSPHCLKGLFLLLLLFFCFAPILSPLPADAKGPEEIVFLKGLFVKEVRGYGLYVEEESNRFHKDDKPTIYLEVDNFKLGVKD